MTTHTFQRGETISVALRNLDGVDVSGITAGLKARVDGQPAGEQLAPVTVEPRADLGGDLGPGWLLTAPSSALPPAVYQMDARLVVGGSIIITDPLTIRITRSASGE